MTRSEPPDQMALSFPARHAATFETFAVGRNAELVALLQAAPGPGTPPAVWLTGDAGVGKSHLLSASVAHTTEAGADAAYLPLDLLSDPEVLVGLERRALVALDAIERWVGDRAREEALMACYEGVLTHGGRWLVAGDTGPGACRFALPDFASRMRAASVFDVQPPGDEDVKSILRLQASERGFDLTDAVLEFWLSRGARDLGVLLKELAVLDRYSLGAQRRLTIPFLKQVLAL